MGKNLTSEVKKALEIYNKDKKYEHYREEEKLIAELFKTHKENTDEKFVLSKVCVLDSLYSTNLRMDEGRIYEMTKHILKLNIDKDLQNKSLELISKIADFTNQKGERKVLYSFATKYCFFHNPSFYIIYDSFVEKKLKSLNDEDKFYNFAQKDIKDYVKFMAIFKSFKSFYGLEAFSNRELDHFLWMSGKELNKQKA